MTPDLLHMFQCRACQTIMVSVATAEYGRPYRCNLCRTPMTFLWSDPITTDEQRALAARGVVYNPGLEKEPTR